MQIVEHSRLLIDGTKSRKSALGSYIIACSRAFFFFLPFLLNRDFDNKPFFKVETFYKI